jgi:hypothetical protein
LVDEALADRSHVSLIAWTGSASTRVFQMLLAGNTPQLVPGTSAARTGTATRVAAESKASTAMRRILGGIGRSATST